MTRLSIIPVLLVSLALAACGSSTETKSTKTEVQPSYAKTIDNACVKFLNAQAKYDEAKGLVSSSTASDDPALMVQVLIEAYGNFAKRLDRVDATLAKTEAPSEYKSFQRKAKRGRASFKDAASSLEFMAERIVDPTTADLAEDRLNDLLNMLPKVPAALVEKAPSCSGMNAIND